MSSFVGVRLSSEIPTTHCGSITSLSTLKGSPHHLLSSSRDGTIRIWEQQEEESINLKQLFCLDKHSHWVNSALSISDNRIAACSSDGSVELFSSESTLFSQKPSLVGSLIAHKDAVTSLFYSPKASENTLFSSGLDGTVRCWDLSRIPSILSSVESISKMFALKLPTPKQEQQTTNKPPSPEASTTTSVPQQHSKQRRFWSFFRSTEKQNNRNEQPKLAPNTQQQPEIPGITLVEGLEKAFSAKQPITSNLASLYSLTGTQNNGLIFGGSSDGRIYAWDPRVESHSSQVFCLEGHFDVVRGIIAFEEQNLIVSASSDSTIRMWDLRQRSPFTTLCLHSEIIWDLKKSLDETGFWSCGSDGKVFRVDLKGEGSSNLALNLSSKLSSIACMENGNVWIGENDGTLSNWNLMTQGENYSHSFMVKKPEPMEIESSIPISVTKTEIPQAEQNQKHSNSISSQPASSPESQIDMPLPPPPPLQGIEKEQFFIQQSLCIPEENIIDQQQKQQHRVSKNKLKPVCLIPSSPSIIKFEILNDKIHILTQDSSGEVSLWNLLLSRQIARFGKVDFRGKIDELQTQHGEIAVPSWFQVSIKTGFVIASFGFPSCFHGQTYLDPEDHNFETPGNVLVNLGAEFLSSIFHRIEGKKERNLNLRIELPPELLIFQSQSLPLSMVGFTVHSTISSTSSQDALLVPWLKDFILKGVVLPPNKMPIVKIALIDSQKQKHKTTWNCQTSSRVEDLIQIIIKKFGVSIPEGQNPLEMISLTCKSKKLPRGMTTETIKKCIWASSEEVEIIFTIHNNNNK